MANREMKIDAPIPGMSLTAEPKSRPWRRPYQFSTVDEVVEFYIPKITDPQFAVLLIEQVENKVPLSTIADILVTANTMEGKHSIDLGVLVAPVLIEGMAAVVEKAGYTPVMTPDEEPLPEDELTRRAIADLKKERELSEKMNEGSQEIAESMREDAEGVSTSETEMSDTEEKPKRGLMAPKKTEESSDEEAL